MAGSVNLKFKFVNSNGVGVSSAAVSLFSSLNNNIYQYQNLPMTYPQTLITSGTTAVDGSVLLTGVNAGVYDIQITKTGNTANIRNYVVKNETPVAIGESNMGFGNSNYIASNESVTNILTQDKTTNAFNEAKYPTDTINVVGDVVNTYTGNVSYPIPLPLSGTEIFNTTVVYGKGSGNSYYHNTDAIPFIQKAKFTVAV